MSRARIPDAVLMNPAPAIRRSRDGLRRRKTREKNTALAPAFFLPAIKQDLDADDQLTRMGLIFRDEPIRPPANKQDSRPF
jgi:hypothetical protein